MKLGKFVLPFLHEDPDSLPRSKTKTTSKAAKQLEKFRGRVMKEHTCKMWKNGTELSLHVTQGLLNAFTLHPSEGWVRSGGPDAVKLLEELNELRQRVETLREENLALREQAKSSAQIRVKEYDADEAVTVAYKFPNTHSTYDLTLSWKVLFDSLGYALLEGADLWGIQEAGRAAILDAGEYHERDHDRASQRDEPYLTQDSARRVLLALAARGLVTNKDAWTQRGDPYIGAGGASHTDLKSVRVVSWYLTPEGTTLFLETKGE